MTLQSWTETPARTQHARPRFALANTLRLALGFTLGLALLSTQTSIANADANADAEALIAQGIDLRRQGKDAEALEAFKRAAETHSTPRALAQIGLAQQALGQWVAAEAHLKLALDHPNNPWISRNRDTLGRSLATVAERLGSVEVQCDVVGASVTVNGVPAGTIPLAEPLRVVAGSAVLEVTATGYHPLTRNLQVSAGSLARETVTLVPMRAATETPAVVRDPAPVVATTSACEGGQVDVEGHCCWPGQRWNSTRQHCMGAPDCPEGTVPSGITCAPAPATATPHETVHERITIREDVVPQRQSPIAVEPAPVVASNEHPAEGGEISLYVGYGGFFRRDASLFLTTADKGPKAFSLGFVGQLAAGYRPVRWVSFGAQVIGSLQEGDTDYWEEQGGEARLLTLSAGAYVRGHLVGELRAGAFDLWLGTGFHPFSRAWVDAKELPNALVKAVAIPLEVGASLFGSSSFALELKFTMLNWMPLDYCVSSDREYVCGATTQGQTSWDAALGFTWVL